MWIPFHASVMLKRKPDSEYGGSVGTMLEGQIFDKKSIRKLTTGDDGYHELAKDCVGFANARGGTIHIGIEDGEDEPPSDQRVEQALVERLRKRMSELTNSVGVDAHVETARNGGEYVRLTVYPSVQSIAATNDGRFFMRVSDSCRPLMPNEMVRLLSEKGAFSWETHCGVRVSLESVDTQKVESFLQMIRRSNRVSDFVKDKTDRETLEYYNFILKGRLTNLGVLWVGRREDRSRLRHAPQVQCIRYDDSGQKVKKWTWLDHELNPLELIEAIWHEVPDWQESEELPDGLFRTSIPHYDPVVVRELVANSLVHRPYTQGGDIFLRLHPDRLEVHNPGPLPIGVTPDNILHQTVKRNDHLARVFYDLGLMESEGSGYDRMYEVLLSSGKPKPEVQESNDRVIVTIYKRVTNPSIADFLDKVNQRFDLSQRERITLGLIAQHEYVTAIDLRRAIAIGDGEDTRPWLNRLVSLDLIHTQGKTKGLRYSINSEVLRDLRFKGGTSLKGIEPHRLRELLLEDLRRYRNASIGEIHKRIGQEIPLHQLRKHLKNLVEEGEIEKEGVRGSTRYIMEN